MRQFKFLSLMIICFGLLSSLSLQAQQRNNKNVDPKVRQENQLKRLTEQLTLTPKQQEQITKIWNDDAAKRKELMDARQNGQTEDFKKQMKEMRDSRSEKMKQILTPDQYTKYLEMQNDQLKKELQKRDRNKAKHRKGGNKE